MQGIGFFVTEGVQLTEDGKEMAEGTWDYKVPTVDTITKRLNVELYNSATLRDRILSSKCKLHHVDWLKLYTRNVLDSCFWRLIVPQKADQECML